MKIICIQIKLEYAPPTQNLTDSINEKGGGGKRYSKPFFWKGNALSFKKLNQKLDNQNNSRPITQIHATATRTWHRL